MPLQADYTASNGRPVNMRIRTSIVIGAAIFALCAATAFGDAIDSCQPGIALTSFLDPAEAPQAGDVQFQSELPAPITSGGPEITVNEDQEADNPGDGKCIWLGKDPQAKIDPGLSWDLDSGGFMFNGHQPKSHFNGPVTYSDRDQGQFDQLYMVGGIGAGDQDAGWFSTFRYDLMFGNDYFFTTAAGLDGSSRGNRPKWYTDDAFRYGWSMPQLFLQVGYTNLNVKFGHFYSPVGYEVAPSAGDFFITHSYAFQYGEPTTQTGMLVSNSFDDCWSWTTGIAGGWDTFDANTRPAFVGGVTYKVRDRGSVAFTLVTGDDSTLNLPGIGPFANRTMYSLVGIANLSSRLTYVFQHDLGLQQDAATLQGTDQAEWYGINQYLFYRLHECLTFGARFEWFRDDDGFNVTGLRPGNPLAGNFFAGNFYETALGLNYMPYHCMTIRPEVRYDSFNPSSGTIGSQNPFDDNTSKYQILYGVDVVLHY
jgi:hypothetical protein